MSHQYRFRNQDTNASRWLIGPLVLLALCQTGCMDADQAKLVGVWQIDTADKVLKRVDSKDPDGEFESEPGMTMEFGRTSLKTSTRVGNGMSVKTGSWRLVSTDESKTHFTIECSLGMQTTEHEIEWIDDQSIKLVPPNMAGLKLKMTFRKK